MHRELIEKAAEAFPESSGPPAMSLRGGNAVDSYAAPPPFADDVDAPTDAYLEANYWGLAHLDPASWRHYVPRLIKYALEHRTDGQTMGRRRVSRLAPAARSRAAALCRSFGGAGERARRVLDCLAFGEASAWSSEATLALEEYWAPGARYRSEGGDSS